MTREWPKQWKKVSCLLILLLCLGGLVLPCITWGSTDDGYRQPISREKKLLRELEEAKRSGNLQRVIAIQKEIERCRRGSKRAFSKSKEGFHTKQMMAGKPNGVFGEQKSLQGIGGGDLKKAYGGAPKRAEGKNPAAFHNEPKGMGGGSKGFGGDVSKRGGSVKAASADYRSKLAGGDIKTAFEMKNVTAVPSPMEQEHSNSLKTSETQKAWQQTSRRKPPVLKQPASPTHTTGNKTAPSSPTTSQPKNIVKSQPADPPKEVSANRYRYPSGPVKEEVARVAASPPSLGSAGENRSLVSPAKDLSKKDKHKSPPLPPTTMSGPDPKWTRWRESGKGRSVSSETPVIKERSSALGSINQRQRVYERETIPNARRKVEAFKDALKSRSPERIRKTNLEIQKDPAAVQEINSEKELNYVRQKYNQTTNEIKSKTTDIIKEDIAKKYGVPTKDVKVVSTTNPRKEPTVGQDWDVTVRVKGEDVPLKISEPAVQHAYHKAAGGGKTDPKDFAREHNVEVTNRSHSEAYGSSIKEGNEIIGRRGRPKRPVRDPAQLSQVMEYKSNLARNRAEDLAKSGNHAGAEAWKGEQARQYTKQFENQIKPRVESAGGSIPEHVQKGTDILNKVGKHDARLGRTYSPADAQRDLAKMGETPESVIKKGTGLVESAQKLKKPSAQQGVRATRDHFVENVKRKIDLKRRMDGKRAIDWERGLQKPTRENLPAGDAPPGSKPLTKGVASFHKESAWEFGKKSAGKGLDATTAAGMLASGVKKEKEDAAREGREFSNFKAVENVGKDIVHGSVVSPFEAGRRAAGEELKRLPEYEKRVRKNFEENLSGFKDLPKESQDLLVRREARTQAAFTASGRALKATLFDPLYDLSKRTLEEEALNEYEDAKKSGEKGLSTWRTAKYKARAAGRIAGEVTGINAVVDWMTYDDRADRNAVDTGKRVNRLRQTKLLSGLTRAQRIKEQIEDLQNNGDIHDPETQRRLQKLQGEYTEAVTQVRRDRSKMKTTVNPDDPLTARLKGEVDRLPDYIPGGDRNAGSDRTSPREVSDGACDHPQGNGDAKNGEENTTFSESNPSQEFEISQAESRKQRIPQIIEDPPLGGDIDDLRNAEQGGAKGSSGSGNVTLANQISSGTTGSYLQNNDGTADTDNYIRTASLTQEERATGAQVQGNVRQDRITRNDMITNYAISQAATEHQSAEGARDDIRNQPTFFDAIMQGLTGGVAQGIDQAFCVFGQRLGQKVSHQWGITRHSSHHGGHHGEGGGHRCSYPDGRCHLSSSPDNNHDGLCDLCGCPISGVGRSIAQNTVKPQTPPRPSRTPSPPPPKPNRHTVSRHRPRHRSHHSRHHRGRHRTVVIPGRIYP